MRVLVACEFSGIVRDAFAERGHDAWSCDIIPSERGGQHIIGDAVLTAYGESPTGEPWDLLIAHPPCTYLANSGVRWLYGGKGTVVDPDRWAQMQRAAAFFRRLLIEIGDHDAIQTVQPYMFGHGETKATQLWLRRLPPLQPTKVVDGRTPRVHFASPGPDRWKERSRTMTGLAEAMADQWGSL